MLNIPFSRVFRPQEGEQRISFVSPLTGPNYLLFTMHWVKTEVGLRPFLCPRMFRLACPLCEKANLIRDPAERKDYLSKTRVLLNVWDMKGEPIAKIWDVSHWLLRKSIPNEEIANPKLWDPSKSGEALLLTMTKTIRGWPEYKILPYVRNVEIPRSIRADALDLQAVIDNGNIMPETFEGDILTVEQAEKLLFKDKVSQIVGEKVKPFPKKRKIILD